LVNKEYILFSSIFLNIFENEGNRVIEQYDDGKSGGLPGL